MSGRRRIESLWLVYFAADVAAIAAAYYAAFLFRFRSALGGAFFGFVNALLNVRRPVALGKEYEAFYLVSAVRIVFFIAVTVCLLHALMDLYSGRRFIRRRPEAWRIVVANISALAFFYGYFYMRRNVFHPRSFLAAVMFLNVVFAVLFRRGATFLLQVLRDRCGFDHCRAVMMGEGRGADYIARLLKEARPHGLHLVAREPLNGDKPFEERAERIRQFVRENNADMIIAASIDLTVAQVMQLLEVADSLGVSAKVLSEKLDVVVSQAQLPADLVLGVPLIHFGPRSSSPGKEALVRSLSLVAALLMSAIMLPLMVLIAVVIRLTTRGPALFVQERIGVNRRPFEMYKFRTMYDRADEAQAQVEEFNESDVGLFKIKKDPRVTPVGRLLRKFSLDELPQLLNVIRGDMRIVGPRPLPRRDFENYYETWHYSRHTGTPGITCLWQVSGRSELDFRSMCILDVYYLRNQTWVMDLKILLKTMWAVVFARGAY